MVRSTQPGWLHAEINVPHLEVNPDASTHPSINRAQRKLTSLIETNALLPDYHHMQLQYLTDHVV